MNLRFSEKGQAMPAEIIPIEKEAFSAQDHTSVFWLETPDGTIWTPGDSRLLEEQLHMPDPDMILFDFADNPVHITFEGAVKLANTYPKAKLVCIHWGTVDAPGMNTFNGNPEDLLARVTNPERVLALNPGEPLILKKD